MIALFSSQTKISLPMTSRIEEFKVAKSKLYMTLGDSDEQVIHDTRPNIKTRSEWSVSAAVSNVGSQMKHKTSREPTQVDRRGIGHSEMIW